MNRLGGPYVELTNKCNLKCVYCYNESNSNNDVFLEFGKYVEILKALRENDVRSIVLSGGEPLLHPRIVEILNQTIQYNIRPLIITNSTITDHKTIESICESESDVQITFDDVLQCVHDNYRGKNTFKKNIEFIDLLRQYGFKGKIIVRAHIREDAVERFGHFMLFLSQLQVDRIDLASIKEMGRASHLSNDLSYSGIISIYEYIGKNKFKVPINVNGIFCGLSEGCPFNNMDDIIFRPRITPNGDVFPCQLFEDVRFCIGNIYNESLPKIVSSNKAEKFVEQIRERFLFLSDNDCRVCMVKNWCSKGCAAKCWQGNADLKHTDGSCTIKKYHYKEHLKYQNYLQECNKIDEI